MPFSADNRSKVRRKNAHTRDFRLLNNVETKQYETLPAQLMLATMQYMCTGKYMCISKYICTGKYVCTIKYMCPGKYMFTGSGGKYVTET